MTGAWKGICREERGASVAEMALVTGLLLLLVAGISELGRAFYTYITITNAAREGARWGSRYPWDEDGIIAATIREGAAGGLELKDTNITIDGLDDEGGEPIRVSVQYEHETILKGLLGSASLTLRNSAEMIIFGLDRPE
jgi:Flp pilus assembly pilin Flp